MEKEHKDLCVFGYGLALLIPFFVWVHAIKIGKGIPLIIFLLAFTLILVTLSRIDRWRIVYYGLLAAIIFALYKTSLQHDFGLIQLIWLGVAAVFLLISLVHITLLKPVYNVWMKVAHGIGTLISGGVLSILFYGVFGVVGICLRLMKKDLLDQQLDPEKDSYWIRREHQREPASYENQF